MPTLKLVFWNETWQSHLPEFERWTPLYPDSLRPDGYRGSSSAAASAAVGPPGRAAEALLQLAAQLRRRPARLHRSHTHGVEEGAALGRAADRLLPLTFTPGRGRGEVGRRREVVVAPLAVRQRRRRRRRREQRERRRRVAQRRGLRNYSGR